MCQPLRNLSQVEKRCSQRFFVENVLETNFDSCTFFWIFGFIKRRGGKRATSFTPRQDSLLVSLSALLSTLDKRIYDSCGYCYIGFAREDLVPFLPFRWLMAQYYTSFLAWHLGWFSLVASLDEVI